MTRNTTICERRGPSKIEVLVTFVAKSIVIIFIISFNFSTSNMIVGQIKHLKILIHCKVIVHLVLHICAHNRKLALGCGFTRLFNANLQFPFLFSFFFITPKIASRATIMHYGPKTKSIKSKNVAHLSLKNGPQYYGHKGDPKVTTGTYSAVSERAQVILV